MFFYLYVNLNFRRRIDRGVQHWWSSRSGEVNQRAVRRSHVRRGQRADYKPSRIPSMEVSRPKTRNLNTFTMKSYPNHEVINLSLKH